MQSTFSIGEALTFGWHKTRTHSGLLFQVLLTIFALQVAQAIVSKVLASTLMGVLASIAIGVAEFIVGVGFTVIALRIAEGKHAEYKQIIPTANMLWRYLLAGLLSGVIILGGLILLIIPGIYFALRYSMVRFFIVEGAQVRESLKKSAAATHGVKWHLLGFFLVLGLLNLAGAILFLVGLLITVPVTMVAYAHVYRKLAGHHAHAA